MYNPFHAHGATQPQAHGPQIGGMETFDPYAHVQYATLAAFYNEECGPGPIGNVNCYCA